MYVVESVGLNRIIRIHGRAEDYDAVLDKFISLRKFTCRELRMVKVSKGTRVLLKFITKVRHEKRLVSR